MVASVRGLPQLLDGSAGRRPIQHFFFCHISANEHGQRAILLFTRGAVKPWTGIQDGQHVASARLLLLLDMTLEKVARGTGCEIGRRRQHALPISGVLSQVALAGACNRKRLSSEVTSSIFGQED